MEAKHMEEVAQEILKKRQELRVLEKEIRDFNKPRFQHECPKCGTKWVGNKEKIKECCFCHRRIDYVDKCKEACARFDELVRSKGEIVKEQRADADKKQELRRIYCFRVKDEGIEYVKRQGGEELERKLLLGSYELLKDWDWKGFLKEYVRI